MTLPRNRMAALLKKAARLETGKGQGGD